MILYHGSREIVEYPVIRKAQYHKDFYFGFYCKKLSDQAKRWASRYGIKGYLNSYQYTPNYELKYLVFEEMTEEWLDFVVACRSGKRQPMLLQSTAASLFSPCIHCCQTIHQ